MKGLPNENNEPCELCKKIPSRISTIIIRTGTISKTFYSCIAHPQKVMLIAKRGMA
jgi:hypothetical protein